MHKIYQYSFFVLQNFDYLNDKLVCPFISSLLNCSFESTFIKADWGWWPCNTTIRSSLWVEPMWTDAAGWSCLTGTVQIAACWLLLDRELGRRDYHDAASLAIDYVRQTIQLHQEPGISGGVKGSFPTDGDYTRFQYPNWAAKFFIDAQLLEIAADDDKTR